MGDADHRTILPRTLEADFDSRNNPITSVRLVLALIVAVVHAQAVGFGHQPTFRVATLGDLAVDAFFVLSGFLITRSYVNLRSLPRYTWHRFLRIMPGFWVCLLVTALAVAPLIAVLQGHPASHVFTVKHDSAQDYLLGNSALLIQQFGIAGLPAGVPDPGVLDGSLWTLFYEAVCYGALAALGLVGLLRRRALVAILVACLWMATALQEAGLFAVDHERMLRFALVFLLGCLAHLYAPRVRMSPWLAFLALAVLVPSLVLLDDYRAAAGPAFAYLCIWGTLRAPLPRNLRTDLSYGVYVYHWPIHQVLVVVGLASFGEAVFIPVSVMLALLAAVASWHLVERPAMALKDVQRRDSGRAASPPKPRSPSSTGEVGSLSDTARVWPVTREP